MLTFVPYDSNRASDASKPRFARSLIDDGLQDRYCFICIRRISICTEYRRPMCCVFQGTPYLVSFLFIPKATVLRSCFTLTYPYSHSRVTVNYCKYLRVRYPGTSTQVPYFNTQHLP